MKGMTFPLQTVLLLLFFQEIMMDHSLRSISYIADIGDLLVIMARRRPQVGGGPSGEAGAAAGEDAVQVIASTPKMICHVFESDEVCNAAILSRLS